MQEALGVSVLGNKVYEWMRSGGVVFPTIHITAMDFLLKLQKQ